MKYRSCAPDRTLSGSGSEAGQNEGILIMRRKAISILMLIMFLAGMTLTSCGRKTEPVPDPQPGPGPDPEPVPGPADDGGDEPEPTADPTPAEKILAGMTTEEKVCQLFMIRPEHLFSEQKQEQVEDITEFGVKEATDEMKQTLMHYPCGGIALFGGNLKGPAELAKLMEDLSGVSTIPLLYGVDEEGGGVARIANNGNFGVKKVGTMGSIGDTGDTAKSYEAGAYIGSYLKQYGFNVDFAPVADVNTNPQNIVIGDRAFSDNPRVAAPMVVQYLKGLQDAGVVGCIKHFPGHGDTEADTHLGVAQSLKTWPQMRDCEMIPFHAGIREGCRLVMVSHIAAPLVTGNDLPATLSQELLLGKLRGELHYKGLIITDSMDMRAITDQYTASSAAICSILSGVDIVLTPEDFTYTFDAVVDAVECGVIPEERIDESVRRILSLKLLLSGR
jgi:Beta-glucosidase-related glycosidases